MDKLNHIPIVPDQGCEPAGVTSCFDCPLSRCIYEMTTAEFHEWYMGQKQLRRETRAVELARLVDVEGVIFKDLAIQQGVTERTIYRLVNMGRKIRLQRR